VYILGVIYVCDLYMNGLFFRLDMSSDLMSLHIGDRILEVNGTPVKDQPIENIENLIRYSDTVLQVCTFV
jgi:LIM domain kinase 1